MSDFCFSLSTRRREDAEKIQVRVNMILTELQEPKDKGTELFELSETEDFEWCIGCVCYYESANAHEQALKQVVVEFPEIKMTYQESEAFKNAGFNNELVSSSYWLATASTSTQVWSIVSGSGLNKTVYTSNNSRGVRPVVIIPASSI